MLNSSLIILLVVYLGAVVFVSFKKSAQVQGRAFVLFRVLLPSWKFFEDLSEVPIIQYRIGPKDEEIGEWQELIHRPKRGLGSLFLNADGNLCLAKHSLLQQVETDIGELDPEHTEPFLDSVSFGLTKNLVEFEIQNRGEFRPGLKAQFRLSRQKQGAPESPLEHFLTSAIYEV